MPEPRRVRRTAVPYEAALCTTKHSSWEPLYVGEWVLKAPDGSLSKVDGDEFDSGFEDVPELASGGIVDTSRIHRVGG